MHVTQITGRSNIPKASVLLTFMLAVFLVGVSAAVLVAQEVYKYKPEITLPFASNNIEIKGGKDGNHIKTLEGGRLATMGRTLLPDSLGSEKIHIVVDPDIGFTELAGLKFLSNCVLNIWKDGTVEVDTKGIAAKDLEGNNYVSKEAEVGGRKAIVMVTSQAAAPSDMSIPDLSKRYKWTTPTRSGGFVIDAPGSKNITYKVNEGEKATYAGLTFGETITASILKDGTLLITKEGVIATDKNGSAWKSSKAILGDESVIAFFPDGGSGNLANTEPVLEDLLPAFDQKLRGSHEVRVRNPNAFTVAAGVRSGRKGINLRVPANSRKSVYVPNGKYDIYFVYSDKPDALFQGDSFTLNNNGVEIQIVKVVNGNYGIRQVK